MFRRVRVTTGSAGRRGSPRRIRAHAGSPCGFPQCRPQASSLWLACTRHRGHQPARDLDRPSLSLDPSRAEAWRMHAGRYRTAGRHAYRPLCRALCALVARSVNQSMLVLPRGSETRITRRTNNPDTYPSHGTTVVTWLVHGMRSCQSASLFCCLNQGEQGTLYEYIV